MVLSKKERLVLLVRIDAKKNKGKVSLNTLDQIIKSPYSVNLILKLANKKNV